MDSQKSLTNVISDLDSRDSRPIYPPPTTCQKIVEIIRKNKNNKKNPTSIKFPNAFLIYRMIVLKNLQQKNFAKLNQGNVSSIASQLWKTEPERVKEAYKKLSSEGE